MAKVSILMNCYNGEKYLREAIDSVIGQTYHDWELIFWDNQSSDSSAGIVKSYNDDRIKYFYAPRHTLLGEARNLGLQECRAEYLAFLDTDDIWLPEKLEKQVFLMDTNQQFVMCYSSALWIRAEGEIFKNTVVAKFPNFETLLRRYDINMQSVLIAQTKIDRDILKFDESLKYCPDFDLFMNIALMYQNGLTTTAYPLVKYRVHNASLSHQTKEIQWQEIEKVLSLLEYKASSLYSNNKTLFESFTYAKDCILSVRLGSYYISIGDYYLASKLFKKASAYNKKYFILYVITRLPISVSRFIVKMLNRNGIFI